MRWITLEELTARMNAGLAHTRCVQAWLGLGDRLFLGFGNEVLDPPSRGKGAKYDPDREPPYQLQTHLSHWIVSNVAGIAGSSHDDPRASAAAESLVGRRTVSWCLTNPEFGLRVTFDDDSVLAIVPYDSIDRSIQSGDLWGLREPARSYIVMTADGTSYEEESAGQDPA